MSVSLGNAEVLVKYPSGKAIKVKTEEHGELNIPVSAIHDDSEVWKEDQEGDLVVEDWFAEKEGLV